MDRKTIAVIAGAIVAVAFGGYVIDKYKVVESVVSETATEQVATPAPPLEPVAEPTPALLAEPTPEVAVIPWKTQPFTVFYSADQAAPVKAGIAVDLSPISTQAKPTEVLVSPTATNAPTTSSPKVRPLSDFLK